MNIQFLASLFKIVSSAKLNKQTVNTMVSKNVTHTQILLIGSFILVLVLYHDYTRAHLANFLSWISSERKIVMIAYRAFGVYFYLGHWYTGF